VSLGSNRCFCGRGPLLTRSLPAHTVMLYPDEA
jgi:hypothetical protein